MKNVKGGLNKILNQAQKLQSKLGRLEENLKQKIVEASAGDGKVTVVMDGNRELLDIRLDESLIQEGNTELIQALIVSAMNLALTNVREMVNQEMTKVTGGFSIPGLM